MLNQTLHQQALHRLNSLLGHLATQANKTDKLNSSHKSHRLLENNNLFARHLFASESDRFSVYVNEVRQKLSEFARLTKTTEQSKVKDELAKIALLQIEQQIAAITNALQANEAMHNAAQISYNANNKVRIKKAKAYQSTKYQQVAKTVMLSSNQLYKKLSEHHEFERRLLEMVSDREQQRIKSKANQQAQLSNEVLALHQRLGRCRKAISAIERDIEIMEKKR